MAFTLTLRIAGSSFQLVRQPLLLDDELPFADQLTVEQIEAAFRAEGYALDDDDTQDNDGAVYTLPVVMWAFLSQMLFTLEERSCLAAVKRIASYYAASHGRICSTNTGAYCRARARVPIKVVRRLTREMAAGCESQTPLEWLWKGRHAQLIDGTTATLADTPENQEKYPQVTSQAAGLGFPIFRAVALISLATGLLHDSAMGPYSGKETGETALFRQLFDTLTSGDVVLADRYYCGWFTLALLQQRGVDVVARMNQGRDTDLTQVIRLAEGDYLAAWPKPPCPDWLERAIYDTLPVELKMRQIDVNVNVPGFRTESLVVVTTLLNSDDYTAQDIADLFRQRWHIELDLRSIKSSMRMDELRSKSPEMAEREWRMGLLAYNAVRQSILQAAFVAECHPRELSFTSSMQSLATNWLLATASPEKSDPLRELRLQDVGSHQVGKRPNRVEPRAIKRRPSKHDLLTKPRAAARAALLGHNST